MLVSSQKKFLFICLVVGEHKYDVVICHFLEALKSWVYCYMRTQCTTLNENVYTVYNFITRNTHTCPEFKKK
jgi:hypothetical protein